LNEISWQLKEISLKKSKTKIAHFSNHYTRSTR
jgi:hypothetical protein